MRGTAQFYSNFCDAGAKKAHFTDLYRRFPADKNSIDQAHYYLGEIVSNGIRSFVPSNTSNLQINLRNHLTIHDARCLLGIGIIYDWLSINNKKD